MVGKKFMKKWCPKICFFDPWKWSEKSFFWWKMVVLCIFTNLKNSLLDIRGRLFFVTQQNGGEWFTSNKKTRSNYVPKHGFWAPKKGSGKSFLVKLTYFGHFHALQNYTCLRWFLLTSKIGGENTPNYDFLTLENGHKSHFSTKNGLFLAFWLIHKTPFRIFFDEFFCFPSK